MIPTLLGLGWGMCAAAPIVVRARRRGPGDRATRLGTRDPRSAPERRLLARVAERLPRLPGAFERVTTDVRSRLRTRRGERVIARELPVTVDLLAVAVASGCTPFIAVEVAARWSPPMLAETLERVRRSSALGRSFADSFADVVVDLPPLGPVADALLVSDHFGAPVRDSLARLAVELRADLRRRAEARARTVPVRLLFPLVFLVLPAFGLLTVVPAVANGLAV